MNNDFFAREWGELRSRKRLIKRIEMRGGARRYRPGCCASLRLAQWPA